MQAVLSRSTGIFDPLSATVLGGPGVPCNIRRYQIAERLGSGATCSVFRAFDPVFERPVAVKVLHGHLRQDPMVRNHLCSEAKSLARLSSPHVVAILEYGDDDDDPFLVLEYVAGPNLEQLVTQGPLDHESATRIMLQACAGVKAAHAAGIVHRDIKPANLLLTAAGIVKLIDFGLSCSTGGVGSTFRRGTVAGTPSFMSPEQCLGTTIDERADIYGLGATYFTLLTGANPYHEQETATKVMQAHRDAPPPDPRLTLPTVPEACAVIVKRAMAKSPQDRFQTVDQFAAELEAAFVGQAAQTNLSAQPAASERNQRDRAWSNVAGQVAFTACVVGVLGAFAAINLLLERPRVHLRKTVASPMGAAEVAGNEQSGAGSER